MRRRATWTALAETELDDVLFHIAIRAGRPSTGEKMYHEIRRLADDYAEENAPRHRHPVCPKDWFYFRHKRWLVFYQPHPDGIEVMRVIDAARDLPGQFAPST